MWYEFPQDAATFSLDQQFMFGDKFLVVPKTSAPTQENLVYHSAIDTPVYLPNGINWYYYWSGQHVAGSTVLQTIPIAQDE
jgi:alpha-D-xyloside xylohydrolase